MCRTRATTAEVTEHFGQRRDAEIYRSRPGLGDVLAARVLGEFGDEPDRYSVIRVRKAYAGTSPITRASRRRCTPARSATAARAIPCRPRRPHR